MSDSLITIVPVALLGEADDKLQAWAERHVRKDPEIKWLLGNFVEADRPNQNGHIFPLEDLRANYHTLEHKALTMLHHEQYIVGTYAGAELLNPDGTEFQADAAEEQAGHPFLESLSAMWYKRFPDEFLAIRGAHAEGALFYSHETTPGEVSCPECDLRVPFAGLESDTYCGHMNGITGPKRAHDFVFSGGAIILPPSRPGWNRADMKQIAELVKQPEAEAVYDALAASAPHLEPRQWEAMMQQVMLATAD